ncbi:MAG TPA: glutamate-5-semialdehyde dehydrogenase [Alphaproteobacteria bacterium]|jgi:glutamate-5-semialdehyde dehydrogenase|nr:glutamate-5-semialdehyde dehydrogenase [Alphaproteobacteria bacterium]
MVALSHTDLKSGGSIESVMAAIGQSARVAAGRMALASTEAKNLALVAAAAAIRRECDAILAANRRDIDSVKGNLSDSMIDRLALDTKRVEGIARGLEEVAALPDPVGTSLARWTRPNGLDIERVRVPLGVIGVIYESRPNVTADAGALCLKAGNAAILRGGSESTHSSRAIHACLVEGAEAAGLPADAIQIVPTTDREAVGAMLRMAGVIDVIVPRGGRSLVERVMNEARMPVFAHLEGLCHVYVDRDADLETARKVVLNAKMRRVSVCGAAETLLVDRAIADTALKPILADLIEAGCEVRGDAAVRAADMRAVAATEADWVTEYLEPIISARVVDGVEGAIAHINHYGSHHTDSILTENEATAERFLNEIDSGIVLVNASTQFADGGEFGMGAEIGISTGKMHARGPVGVEQLTSYKYKVRGRGQVRP